MGIFGTQIGNYRIGKTLGKGQFSKVKAAKNAKTGESVAIKILDKAALEAAKAEEEVMHEVQLMKLVQHPNIVNLIEVIASKDSIFLVMEYVIGGDLFEHIVQNGAMEEEEAKRIFCQLMDGVEFCHMNNIFHRDIKADNVLLTEDGQAKLADFGLGAVALNHLGAEGRLTTFAGTANCAAPEVLTRTAGYAGAPADIWSLGVLLYFLTSQRAPFYGPEYSILVSRVSQGTYHEPLCFSSELASFLQSIFRIDPTTRATFEELRQHPWIKPEVERRRFTVLHPAPSAEDLSKAMLAPRPMTMDECDSLDTALSKGKKGSGGMNAFELMASALDISAIFDDQKGPARASTRVLTRAGPVAIAQSFGQFATSRGGRLIQSSKSRCKLVAVRTRKGQGTAYVDLVDVLPGLLMIKFLKASGSEAAFQELFKDVFEDPECKKLLIATDTARP